MASTEIGLNYATALLDCLGSPGEIQKAGDDLDTFGALLKKLPALSRVLDHPGMPLERRHAILDEVLELAGAHLVTRRFLRIVVDKGRVREIPGIISSFVALRDARLNVTRAEVVTAVPLDDKAQQQWARTLGRVTGKTVSVTYRTDISLLGGALARVGSVVYDGSVRRQLARIRGALLGEQSEKTR